MLRNNNSNNSQRSDSAFNLFREENPFINMIYSTVSGAISSNSGYLSYGIDDNNSVQTHNRSSASRNTSVIKRLTFTEVLQAIENGNADLFLN